MKSFHILLLQILFTITPILSLDPTISTTYSSYLSSSQQAALYVNSNNSYLFSYFADKWNYIDPATGLIMDPFQYICSSTGQQLLVNSQGIMFCIQILTSSVILYQVDPINTLVINSSNYVLGVNYEVQNAEFF